MLSPAAQDVPAAVVEHVARQVDVAPEQWLRYRWTGRTIKYHRAQIREALGFHEATMADGEAVVAWLVAHVLPHDLHPDHLHHQFLQRCRALRVEPPAAERIDRLVRKALHAFEECFCAATLARLSPEARAAPRSVVAASVDPGR